jgi:hypothetical protein
MLKASKGAVGIAQIMPKVAKKPGYGVKPIADRTDPETSLEYAAQYMRAMLDKFGNDYSLALAAYNAGPGNVQKYGGIPPFKETRDYVAKIMGGTGGTGEYDVTRQTCLPSPTSSSRSVSRPRSKRRRPRNRASTVA